MSYELIITEKPSAAKKIAFALADKAPKKKNIGQAPYYELKHKGKDIVVSCAVGHLFSVAEKKKSFSYPSFDVEWKATADIDKKAAYSRKYITAIKKLSKDAASYTVACDYDIEGEVIGLKAIQLICKQDDANRMKFSTLTKPDLIESYESKQGTLDWGQAKAGETRHVLDWLYGINISRALTTAIKKAKSFKVLSSGRVQGPALKILVDRELEIREFVPEKYWELELHGSVKSQKIIAQHKKGKFSDEKECLSILEKTAGKDGKVVNISSTKKNQPPPFPFDLTTLQTESYRHFRLSPKKTLAIAQELYLAGLISYPRTSSQKLPDKIGYTKIIAAIKKNFKKYSGLADMLLSKKYLKPNQGKKDDPAHPAIYPTGYNSFEMNSYQTKIYDLIVKRFFATFGEWAKRESNTIDIDVAAEIFVAKGTRTVEKGWHVLYEPYAKFKEEELPKVEKEDIVKVKKIKKLDKETEPPKRYSQASLIKELEKRNLGTKATRAQIIDSLYQRDYVDERSIHATELGIRIVQVLKKFSPKIVDEKMTRDIEDEMEKIRQQELTPEKAISKAKKDLTEILDDFKSKELQIGNALKSAYREAMTTDVGKCPSCKEGNLVLKSSRKTRQRFLACDRYPDCKTIYSVPQHGKIKPTDKICDECGFPMIIIANKKKQTVCFNPDCKSRLADDLPQKKKEKCPKCKTGDLVLRNSVYGQFYGCSNYPKCRYTERIAKKKDEQ